MQSSLRNKRKIINDPVFGFITIQSDLVFDLLEHPYLQRLRRIKQLGLSYMIYPGANHSRFEHTIGAIHLMRQALAVLKAKGHDISDEEAEAATIAILLHDIGHGPFSHVLENSLVGVKHEDISALMIDHLNREFNNQLELALQIFENKYHKHFLHQLVSGQLDMDRLDYLARDSFFTGVAEGIVGIDRIIKMLDVHDDRLVVEAKGVYSIEKFLIARRLMYWQVYLHKTVLGADAILVSLLKRARALISSGHSLFTTPALKIFLEKHYTHSDFIGQTFVEGQTLTAHFASLDDIDIMAAIKAWQHHPDFVLSFLAGALVNRKLFSATIFDHPVSEKVKSDVLQMICMNFKLSPGEASFLFTSNEISNSAYSDQHDLILVLDKSGTVKDIRQASDIQLAALTQLVRKFFLCYPKELVDN